MSDIKELSTGVKVDVRPVPPYVQARVRRKFPDPPMPMVTMKADDGHTEVMPPLPGTEEYDEYRTSLADHRNVLREALTAFMLDYGIVKWQFPGEEEWHTKPPKDWSPPDVEILRMLGLDVSSDTLTNRVLYIEFELLITEDDARLVREVTESRRVLTKEEIVAALSPFVSDEPIDLWKFLEDLRR